MRPLEGIKVIELAGLAPSPYCGLILADFGAEVVIVDRLVRHEPDVAYEIKKNPFDRGKRSIRINLREEKGIEIIKKLILKSDVLIEPFRPGVMERLGLSPESALEMNPKLIYARLTGWGQNGPNAHMAGHDINYIALAGALSLFRRKGEKPLPPSNLLADFAGGGMLCALGILLAIIERDKSGKGQVVDAAMTDGVVYLLTQFYALFGNDLMSSDIGTNILDGGAPYYNVYETADGKYMSVGAIEEKFYADLIDGLGLTGKLEAEQNSTENWPKTMALFKQVFKSKRRDEWVEVFSKRDACVTPVLELNEVEKNSHIQKRELLLKIDDLIQPAPAPKLSRTPGFASGTINPRGRDTIEILKKLGYSKDEINWIIKMGVVENAEKI